MIKEPEKRFLEAFQYLMMKEKVTVRGFCRHVGISHSNFINWKNNPDGSRRPRIEWYVALCDYGISGEWLLTGNGSMLKI